MTAAKDFIVAIELGSSRIRGIAGKKNSDGSIQILAYAYEDSSEFIRKGIIYNINKTISAISVIVQELERQTDSRIKQVYVGMGGQSLHSVKNVIVETLGHEAIISTEIISRLVQNNRQTRYPGLEVLGVVTQEYKVKNDRLTDPVGIVSDRIEGTYLNLVMRASVMQNIKTCFEQAGVEIAGFFIAPVVAASLVLTEAEKRLGCVLVDMGAETTTVSIYKNDILRHLVVIPLGGNSITKDICSLQMTEEEAEELKLKYGAAYAAPGEDSDNDKYPVNESRNIPAQMLNDVVGARAEEIIANIRQQILVSGYFDKLRGGVVLMGGGSNLNSLAEAFAQKAKLNKVRMAGYVNIPVKSIDKEMLMRNGRLNTILALLASGNKNCCMPEPEPMVPVTPVPDRSEEELKRKKEAEEAARREERERQEREAAAQAAAAEEAERKRKAQEAARTKANTEALAKLKDEVERMSITSDNIAKAWKDVQQAKTDKSTKAAESAHRAAESELQKVHDGMERADGYMASITEEAFQGEAREALEKLNALVTKAEETGKNVTALYDEVKKENSLSGRFNKILRQASDTFLKE